MTDPAQRDERRDDRRRGARSGPTPGGMSGGHLRVAVVPATAVAVLGVATVAFVLAGGRSVTTTRIVLVAAAALAALVLIAAVTGAASATRRLQLQVAELRRASSRARDELALLADRAQGGEQPAPAVTAGAAGGEPAEASEPFEPFEPAADSDGFAELAGDLERERHAAQLAVVQAVAQAALGGRPAAGGGRGAGGGADERVEVFVNLARRMQSLVHQEIQLLDDLEAQVEDPVLLKALFSVDHLATRMRRQSESLAVLGGAVSRRQWSRPVPVHEVLRAAVAEVEQYSRVKVVPPVEGTLQGGAVTDVIHLVAELLENATRFSAPHTHVMVRAQLGTAGLVVEVEDHGLGMRAAGQQRMNALLAEPGQVNTGELLRDGRIGLFVVATLARRHGIRVQLQGNVHGGVQAVIVLPLVLIEAAPAGPDETTRPGPDGTAQPGPDGTAQPGPDGPAVPGPDGTTQPGSDETEPVPSVTHEPAARGTLPVRQAASAAPPEGAATSSAPPRRVPARTLPARIRAAAAPEAGMPSGEMASGAVAAGVPEAASRPPARRTPRRPPAPRTPAGRPTRAGPRTAATPDTPDAPDGPGGEEPELPRRVSQTHLAPELREARTRRRDGPAEDQIPGLMADFQRGASRAAEEDRPAETDSPR